MLLLESSTPTATLSGVPARLDLAVYRGDDFPFSLTLTGPDGLPADLTGAVPLAQVRTSTSSDQVLADMYASVADPTSGQVGLLLSGLSTSVLPRYAAWDCQIIWPDSTVQTVVAGQVIASGEVSR